MIVTINLSIVTVFEICKNLLFAIHLKRFNITLQKWCLGPSCNQITEFELYEAYRKTTIFQRPNAVNPFNDDGFNLVDAIEVEERKSKNRYSKK